LGALLLEGGVGRSREAEGCGEEGRGREERGGEGRGKERAMSPPPSIWREFTPMLKVIRNYILSKVPISISL